MILALDLGTTFGYAFSDGRSGSFDCKSDVQRFLRFQRWLEENAEGVERIAYEDVKRHIGTRAAHVYGGFKALLETFASARDIPLQPVGVGSLKKWATGNGSAKKPVMIAAARRRGWKPVDDNEADALWLLDYSLQSGSVSTSANSASNAIGVDDRRRSKRR